MKIDSVDRNTEDPVAKQPVTYSQSKNISEDASAELMAMLADITSSMKYFKGTMDCYRGEMKGMSRILEAKMTDGFKTEGIQRKTDYDDLEAKMRKGFESESAKMEAGFKNEENERRKVRRESNFRSSQWIAQSPWP